MFERYKYILNIAVEAVLINKFRTILTALGIIFGVAAVIAMMAIGRGAQKVILDQMKMVGVNNIIILPSSEKTTANESGGSSSGQQSQQAKEGGEQFSPGLTLKDAESIRGFIPTVQLVSPEVVYEAEILREDRSGMVKIIGTTPDFFHVFGLEMRSGEMFSPEQLREGKSVCIIGPNIKSRFFPKEDPLGKDIKCGPVWFKVIGVLNKREISGVNVENLGVTDYNNSIFIPIRTLLLRMRDRSAVVPRGGRSSFFFGGDIVIYSGSDGGETGNNQLDKIVVQVRESGQIRQTTELLKRMLLRRHKGVEDVEIKVPELLLKQEQKTKDIFNIVLGAIASISLIVGGIGIMNIMLASVMERIKEIGIRQAMGATKRDVVLQFLTEATIISISGGLIGVVLGIALSKIIMQITGILTIVTLFSILISFLVSASVGIIFGYMPAKRAARHDPVESLRYE